MTFNANISAGRRRFLRKEYDEYAAKTEMTESERNELNSWVSQGHSPYSNPANITDESGREMDFIRGIRTVTELAG